MPGCQTLQRYREEMNSLLPNEAGVRHMHMFTHTCAQRHKHTYIVLCLQCAHMHLLCEECRPVSAHLVLYCPQTQPFAPGNIPLSPPRDEIVIIIVPVPRPGLRAKAPHRPAGPERGGAGQGGLSGGSSPGLPVAEPLQTAEGPTYKMTVSPASKKDGWT